MKIESHLSTAGRVAHLYGSRGKMTADIKERDWRVADRTFRL